MRRALALAILMNRSWMTILFQPYLITTWKPTLLHRKRSQSSQSSILEQFQRLLEPEGRARFAWKSVLRLASRSADISLIGIAYTVGEGKK